MSARRLACLGLFVFALGSAAHAGTLSSATWTTDVFGVPYGVPIAASGTSSATSISVSVSVPAFTASQFVLDGVLGPHQHVQFLLGGNANITASPSMAAATAGIPGTVIVMTANHMAKGVNASMFAIGVANLFHVPLDIGESGTFASSTAIVSGVPISWKVERFAWTVHTQTFTGLTSKGAPIADVVAMGSFA